MAQSLQFGTASILTGVVIKRRDTITGQPARQPLGHVAVCTDDLQALIDLLEARTDIDGEVVVEFDEGEFNEGKDLKELGDASLRDLRVKAGDLVVHLTDNRAEAIGPASLAAFVDNAWARSRQTSRYPDSRKRAQRYPYRSAAIGMTLFTAGILLFIFFSIPTQDRGSPRTVLGMIVMGILLELMAYLLYASNKAAYDRSTWAVIRPLTAHEVREIESRRTTVPLWSLVATGIGLIISTTFLILNYLKR